VTRLVVDLPEEHRLVESFHPVAFAPDGAALVYAAIAVGATNSQLFLHRLDRFEAEAIPDTVGARDPFFSPDGQWVGFLAGRALQRISLDTGAVATIHDGIETFRGASWAIDDSIVLLDLGKGLLRIPATGGEPEPLATPDDRGLIAFHTSCPMGRRCSSRLV
jgi:serine/threonine-protein kinase